MLSIGQQLAQARHARGITPEEAAFHTRIPVALVRDLENDDLSHFANITYARGFLKIYSRYLDVDISDYLSQLNISNFAKAAGREYVETAKTTRNLPTAVFTDSGRPRRMRLCLLAAIILGIAGFFVWLSRTDKESVNKPALSPEQVTNAPGTSPEPPSVTISPVPASSNTKPSETTVPPGEPAANPEIRPIVGPVEPTDAAGPISPIDPTPDAPPPPEPEPVPRVPPNPAASSPDSATSAATPAPASSTEPKPTAKLTTKPPTKPSTKPEPATKPAPRRPAVKATSPAARPPKAVPVSEEE